MSPAVSTLANLVISGVDLNTASGISFLLGDNKLALPPQPRILVFSCAVNLIVLRNSVVWAADGTFASCPEMFGQLWVIHAQVQNAVYPLVFCLMETKNTEDYVRALKYVRSALNEIPVMSFSQAPKRGCPCALLVNFNYSFRVLLDFERAQSNAFGLVFGEGIHQQGCFFHFRQANLRWIKNEHPALWAWLYALKGDHSRRQLLNRFIALAFLKEADCMLGFIELCESSWFI